MKLCRSRSSRSAGFTLLELLVVLAIMALALTVLPRAMNGLPTARLRAAADAAAIEMRELRDIAKHQGTITDFELDLEAQSYRTSAEPVPRPFPSVVKKVAFQSLSVRRQGIHPRIRFFPDGSATQAKLTFWHGSLDASVVVDGLTGRVHRP